MLAAADGLDTLVLYRRPNLQAVADVIIGIREKHMGEMVPTSSGRPMRLARGLAANRHVAILVDQHYVRGVEVTFFGRRCMANPLVAVLARETECAIHGTRVIRLPNGRFMADFTEPVRTRARCRGQDRRSGHDAGDHECRRGLGARASRTMAVAASPLAVACKTN